MKFSKFTYVAMSLALVAGFSSCSDEDDYIPPAIEEPEKPDVPDTEERVEPAYPLHEDGQPYDSWRGLVMCGYQGWFGTPTDGSPLTEIYNQQWYHYRESEQFGPGVLRNSIDFWPDMREYTKTYTPGVDMHHDDVTRDESARFGKYFYMPDGSPAKLFSSYDFETVDLHFKWMKEYGIDGVFMQRFLGEVLGNGLQDDNGGHRDHFNKVLDHAMKASNTYQRAIAVMYDLSGTNKNMLDLMVQDAQWLMNTYQLNNRDAQQKFYLYENERPLIALWGVGFIDRTYDEYLPDIVDQLNAQGWSVCLGCPGYWREGGNDSKPAGAERTAFHNLIKKCDAFLPWYVGRYGMNNFDQTWTDRIAADVAWAKSESEKAGHQISYAVHVFPGGSDRNMHPNNGMGEGDNTTGFRYHGDFFWKQIINAARCGAECLYIGMFDEIDEGTAIFKQYNVKDVPSNEHDGNDYYVTYFTDGHYSLSAREQEGDNVRWSMTASEINFPFQGIDNDLPTDHYLWLTGKAKLVLTGIDPITDAQPSRE